jgi:hypothetical protein
MKLKHLYFSILLVFFVGCTPPTLFYWGDYSSTLYDLTKNPDDKTLAPHKKSLQDIIVMSPQRRLQVPPGVYAEYGFMLIKEGKETEGLENFDKEISLYPESKVFIQRLKNEFVRGKK